MPEAVVTDALRTPVGRYGGALADVRPDDLAAHVIRAAVARNGIDPERIEDVVFGDANQAGETTATSRAWARCSRACPSACPA